MRKKNLVLGFVFILSLIGAFFWVEPLWAAEPKIAAGSWHTVALKSDGTLWAWGDNSFGQLGDGTSTQRNTPVQVSAGGNTWVAIAAGYYHTVALKSDGSLWAWGYNNFGQLGDGTTTQRNTPVQVSGGGNTWVAIAAGSFHTVALKSDGSLWTWGYNYFGQLGDGTNTDRNTPVQVYGGGNTWVRIAAGKYHTVALKSDGTLWAWGNNLEGELGDGTTTQRNTPVEVSGGGNTWTTIAAGYRHTVALKSDGSLWAWGWNNYGQLGDGTSTDRNTPVQVSGMGNTWVTIAAGNAHTVALKSDGTLWAWGVNNSGQLGDGTTMSRNTPVQVSGGGNTWTAIAAGSDHSVALKSDGTLWAWGFNGNGGLGDGTTTNRSAPVQVSGGGNTWVAIAAGQAHTVALKSDGTLWAWGFNFCGQLGDGTNTDRNTPVQVSGGGNTWTAIAAGSVHTVALKSDGTLWTWGYNQYGQLGDGTTTNRNTPVQVSGGGNTWVTIAAGGFHTVARKSDGTLWAWGYNSYGGLGDSTNTDRNTPVQVSGMGNTWTAIAAGSSHTVALKSDGSLWVWGWNLYGQLGDGTTLDRNTPVQVFGGGNTWRTMAAGTWHTVALKSGGSLWAWGGNGFGQLGDGTNIERHIPFLITNTLLVDYDGDEKADIAVYHSASGLWFIHPSSGAADYYVGYGGTGYIPVPGDYDGDRKTDIAVYHSASGLWFIRKSSDGASFYVSYGGSGFDPVMGDFDGDGKTDFVVYHQASGLWYIMQSSNYGSYNVSYGGSGYVPVPGDYDGDGKTDIAVYHQDSGLWFIKPSSGAVDYSVGYGGTGYYPIPGDYDEDGKTDIAVYHLASGLWFIKPSTGAADYYVGYGGTDYTPVNMDYLHGYVY